MNQDNRVNDPNAPENNPMRSKRGRPRKNAGQDPSPNEGIPAPQPRIPIPRRPVPRNRVPAPQHGIRVDRNFFPINLNDTPNPPPGFQASSSNNHQATPPATNNLTPQAALPATSNNNPTLQASPSAKEIGIKVGQLVPAVIENVFDAGCLLSMRIGNPQVTMRGAVLIPGRVAPITPENDIVPEMEMIRRHEVPLPQESQIPAPRRAGPRRRESNGPRSTAARNGNPARRRQVPIAPVDTAQNTISSSHLAPVILRPVSSANEPSPNTSKGKQVVTESTPATPNRILITGRETPNRILITGREVGGREVYQTPTEVLHRVEPQFVASGSSEGSERTISVDPLQAPQFDGGGGSSSAMSQPVENFRPGRMTQLLRAVEVNMTENHAHQAEDMTTGPEQNVGNPSIRRKEFQHGRKQNADTGGSST